MAKSHKWLMDNIDQMSIQLAAGSRVVLDSIYTVPIVFCSVSGYAIA